MSKRIDLHNLLLTLGTDNVYYQPPETLKMKYPAIVYSLNGIRNDNANDEVYIQSRQYQVTVIDKDPDSEIVKNMSVLPMCTYNRHFAIDNLNHDIFVIYY